MFLKPYEYSLYSVIYIEFNNWQNSSKVVKGRIVDILGVRTVTGRGYKSGFWGSGTAIPQSWCLLYGYAHFVKIHQAAHI